MCMLDNNKVIVVSCLFLQLESYDSTSEVMAFVVKTQAGIDIFLSYSVETWEQCIAIYFIQNIAVALSDIVTATY